MPHPGKKKPTLWPPAEKCAKPRGRHLGHSSDLNKDLILVAGTTPLPSPLSHAEVTLKPSWEPHPSFPAAKASCSLENPPHS